MLVAFFPLSVLKRLVNKSFKFSCIEKEYDKPLNCRVSEEEPASGTELWEDSYAAKVMWLLSDNKWFTE